MTKTLTKHGNSYALIIDKPILDLLKIDPDTPLNITTDGKCLFVSPSNPARRRKFDAAVTDTIKKYPNMLRRLAS
jgi:antitoxin component of MazEF toxin-antitoxin module